MSSHDQGHLPMLNLGHWRVDRLADIEPVRLPPGRGFPQLTPALLREHAARLGPRFIDPVTLELLISFHTWVLRGNGLTILVDTCIGDHKHRPARPDWHQRDTDWLERLAALGVSPESVDMVMCTHMHADHVGWNTRLEDGQWVPTFPNARYLMAEVEYRHWERRHATEGAGLNHGSFADSVLPIVARGQAEMVSMSHRFEGGLCFEPAAGHTPGTVLIHVEDTGHHGVLTGDILHHPMQLRDPAMPSAYCEDPIEASRVRVALCERFADTPTQILTAHFPAPSVGRIVRDGSHFDFVFTGEVRS
jgi:glyoxylase-like metal-dependent hydrolase (beta-lactamase superfamily II)